MKAPARLGLYGLVLAVVFAVAFVTAGAVVPEATVQNWAGGSTDEHAVDGHEGQAEEECSLGLGWRSTQHGGSQNSRITGEDLNHDEEGGGS